MENNDVFSSISPSGKYRDIETLGSTIRIEWMQRIDEMM